MPRFLLLAITAFAEAMFPRLLTGRKTAQGQAQTGRSLEGDWRVPVANGPGAPPGCPAQWEPFITKFTTLRVIAFLVAATAAGQTPTPYAEGLQLPQRLIPTVTGNLLVTEGGTAANTGRVSLVNRQGVRRTLLEGLPSARGHGIQAFGPTGMALDGQSLYLLIGEGDVLIGPPFSVNPDGPSSPIFSSVLRIQFTRDIDAVTSAFRLVPGDHWALHDGYDVTLRNADGDAATVHLLTIFRAMVRNVIGGAERVRRSDPYSAWLDARNNALYIIDAAGETLIRVNTGTGRQLVLTRFQPHERLTPTGPEFVDNVPTALCPVGASFLVSFLSASPFPRGEASVVVWNPADGSWSRPAQAIGDLTLVNDMVCLPGGTATAPRVVTLEISDVGMLGTLTGRVQIFEGSQTRVLAQGLRFPTGLTQDP
jgi:hypothetical protein